MLKRYIEIGADIVMCGHNFKKLIGNTLRLHIHHTKPCALILLGKRGHQPCKAQIPIQIITPSTSVLSDEHDLFLTRFHLRRYIRIDLIEGEAVVSSADHRDRAIRAPSVATVGYFHVSEAPTVADRIKLGIHNRR